MEASNELIKKLLEYNFIRINHEPYKQFKNEKLFDALKYANNRDADAESLYHKLAVERDEVDKFNRSIKDGIDKALDDVVTEAENMFLHRWVAYNYADNSLSSKNMLYMYVKDVYIDDRHDLEHTTHFIVLRGPSVYVAEAQYTITEQLKYSETETIKFIPAVYYRDDKEIKEIVRLNQLKYSTQDAFNERIDAMLNRFHANVTETRNKLIDAAVPN